MSTPNNAGRVDRSLEARIAAGEWVPADQLTYFLRRYRGRPIPESVIEYVCGRLDGSIAGPRGRQPDHVYAPVRRALAVAFYASFSKKLKNKTLFERLRRRFEQSDPELLRRSRHEWAAYLTAAKIDRWGWGSISAKTVRNVVSDQAKFAPPDNSPALSGEQSRSD